VVAELLKARPLQKIGDWSYAIYLGQTAWLLVIRYFANAVYPPPDTAVLGTTFFSLMWWLEPLLLVPVCLVWGAALAEWVEKPAARFLRERLGRRLDPKSIPTPS
jgi:peptidoglycan/LPS O-acetylase OafA/YrhL